MVIWTKDPAERRQNEKNFPSTEKDGSPSDTVEKSENETHDQILREHQKIITTPKAPKQEVK